MKSFILSDISGKIRTYNDKRIMTNITTIAPTTTTTTTIFSGITFYETASHVYISTFNDITVPEGTGYGCSGTLIGATGNTIGAGVLNTPIMISNNCSILAGLATGYTGGGYNDWYLPSGAEIIYIVLNRPDLLTVNNYFSSTENNTTTFLGKYYDGDSGNITLQSYSKNIYSTGWKIKPIRRVAK